MASAAVNRQARSPALPVRSREAPDRTRRGTSTRPSRTATCGSTAYRAASRGSAPSSRSTRTNWSGCSSCAHRTRPHTAAASGSGSSPTAPRVAIASRRSSEPEPASQSCTRRSAASAVPVSATANSSAGTASGSGTGVHSTANRPSAPRVRNCPGSAGRIARCSTPRRGDPAASVTVTLSPSEPVGDSLTRALVAPLAQSEIPLQANGRYAPSPPGASASSAGCSAASSSAGWRPNPAASPASSGRATSASRSAPCRQAARSPWKAGPYA